MSFICIFIIQIFLSSLLMSVFFISSIFTMFNKTGLTISKHPCLISLSCQKYVYIFFFIFIISSFLYVSIILSLSLSNNFLVIPISIIFSFNIFLSILPISKVCSNRFCQFLLQIFVDSMIADCIKNLLYQLMITECQQKCYKTC